MPDAVKLEPCPFCGFDKIHLPEIENPDLDFQWSIQCVTCGARIDGFENEKAAREGWNSRATRTPSTTASTEGAWQSIETLDETSREHDQSNCVCSETSTRNCSIHQGES
jgi:Lar family restriction alleviation protein